MHLNMMYMHYISLRIRVHVVFAFSIYTYESKREKFIDLYFFSFMATFGNETQNKLCIGSSYEYV